MSASSHPTDAQVRRVYAQVLAEYGLRADVSGIDIGYAAAADHATPELVVRVHVTGERSQRETAGEPQLPREIDGVKIVVIQAGYGLET